MEKRHSLTKILLFSCLLGFIFISLPLCQNIAIGLAENHLHRSLRDPLRWKEIVMHCGFIGIFVCLITYFLIFSTRGKAISKIVSEEKNKLLNYLISNNGLRLFFFTSILLYIAYFKIIDSNFYYDDDIWRAQTGSRSWIGLGRYVSEFLSIFIHNNILLQDIAPLTQFISLFIMSLTLILLCWIINDNKISVGSLLATSTLFISPFFAQNFSYKYDSPYMTLAVLFPIIPFLFFTKKNTFIFTSIAFLILGNMSYQAGTSVYILLTIFLTSKDILNEASRKDILNRILSAVLAYSISLILYRLLFVNTQDITPDSHSSITISISAIPKNLLTYIHETLFCFGGIWTKFFLVVCILLAISSAISYSKICRKTSLMVIISALLIGYSLSFGAYIIFDKPLLAHRAYIGFDLFIALICYCASKKLKSIPSFLLLYGCIVCLFSIGNAFTVQKNYQEFRTEMLIKDISEFTKPDSLPSVIFDGSIGFSDAIEITEKNYSKLYITSIMRKNCIWNDDFMSYYNFRCNQVYADSNPGYPLLKSTVFHDIYGDGNNFYVHLKEANYNE